MSQAVWTEDVSACLSYFSAAIMKYYDQKQLHEERVLRDIDVIMAGKEWHAGVAGAGSQLVTFPSTLRKQKGKRKWSENKCSGLVPVTDFLQPGFHLTEVP